MEATGGSQVHSITRQCRLLQHARPSFVPFLKKDENMMWEDKIDCNVSAFPTQSRNNKESSIKPTRWQTHSKTIPKSSCWLVVTFSKFPPLKEMMFACYRGKGAMSRLKIIRSLSIVSFVIVRPLRLQPCFKFLSQADLKWGCDCVSDCHSRMGRTEWSYARRYQFMLTDKVCLFVGLVNGIDTTRRVMHCGRKWFSVLKH